MKDQVGWFPSTFVRPLTKDEEAALGGDDDAPPPAAAAAKTVAKTTATTAAASKTPAAATTTGAKAVAKTAAAPAPAVSAAASSAAKTASTTKVPAAAAPVTKTAIKTGASAVSAGAGLRASDKKEPEVKKEEVAAPAKKDNPSDWSYGSDFADIAATVTSAWSKAASSSKGRDQSSTFEGRSLQSGVVVWASPSHCAVEGNGAGQMVSLQESAATLVGAQDLKAAANDFRSDKNLSELLQSQPLFCVSSLAASAARANIASVYSMAAQMEAPFDEAVDAIVNLRSLSSTLAGIAEAFAKLGNTVAVTGANGLSIWAKNGLAVVSFHPDIGKTFVADLNKLK